MRGALSRWRSDVNTLTCHLLDSLGVDEDVL